MMEKQLEDFLKSQGWFLLKRKRGRFDYFYAQKWRAGEIYISSQNNLPNVTKEQILKKMERALQR